MEKRWRFLPHDGARIERLLRETRVPSVVAQLLVSRGVYAGADARRFLETRLTELREPSELPGVQAAAELLHGAIRSRRIVVYGDYDADGMTGAAILYSGLRMLGADVTYHVPNRLEEGYGLSGEALRKLAERGRDLVITVDCGIASVAEAALCRELGLQLIVTDHHAFADSLPEADAVVHPRLPGTDYPFGGLCGAGVAFKLAWALCQEACGGRRVTDALRRYLMQSLALAAIGTVADVVPLVDENRVLVRHGLRSLLADPPLGLKHLMRISGLDKKPALSSEDIAFTLAPRLNAAGRLGQAQLGVELLTTTNPDRAEALAEYIDQLNNSRGSLERSVYLAAQKQAKEQFDPHQDAALVLAGAGWHAGVIGVVAGRLAERYHRPVVILSLDSVAGKPAVGSARSAGVVDLHAALRECESLLITSGGHAAAAGLKVEEANVEAFRGAFCEVVARRTAAAGGSAPEVVIDAEAPLGQLTLETVAQIEELAPFGEGNPRPVLCATRVRLAEPPRTMGGGDRHLSAKLEQNGVVLRSVAFGQGEWAGVLAEHVGPIDVAYRPVINDFRGRRNVEVHLVDWRPAGTAAG